MGFGPQALPTGAPGAAEIAAKAIAEEKLAEVAVEEIKQAAEEAVNLTEFFETDVTNPLAATYVAKRKSIEEQPIHIPRVEKEQEKQRVVPERQVKDEASKFERRYDGELKQTILIALLDRAKNCRDKEELLKLVNEFYPDPLLADGALEFLLATTRGDLQEIVRQAREEHQKLRGREIQAGRNISEQVQQYVSIGLGAPSKLRDLYRDITGNPRDPVALFLELGDRFSYKEMRKVLAYLFHALGSDLKSQGPSIPPGLLHRLLSEVRNLQAGLGVLQFFRNRMRLVTFLFQHNQIDLPQQLNFETLSRQFITLVQERYPAADKAIQSLQKLGISKETLAKIIVLSQMRDAVREVALNQFFRSLQHRDELYKAILDALEQLEEALDEELESAYEEEDQEGLGKQTSRKKEDVEEEEEEQS